LSSSKQNSNTYDLPNHHRRLSKENLLKSFAIHRRKKPNDNENNYKQPKFHDSDDEQQSNDFSSTVFNIQYTSTTQVY
jgi:hypothetical protein